tara:strand:+ start:107 stop:643 length:537 start_codon:yes stop_codon:yes gene_type:complete
MIQSQHSKYLILIFLHISLLIANCDGFNWYHNFNIIDCHKGDIEVLEDFINNSKDSLLSDMDINYNGIIEPLELGWQFWENGRLIHWVCQDVPSPYYFYEYNCGLSGSIPKSINNLSELIKLRLHKNNLNGIIPESICDLQILNDGSYWFDLSDNNFCPPYPECIKNQLGKQRITNCK